MNKAKSAIEAQQLLAALRRLRKRLSWIMIPIGIAILVFLIAKAGVSTIITTLARIGIGFIVLTLLSSVAARLLNAYRFKMLIPKRLSFPEVLKIHLSGFLLNYGTSLQGAGTGAKILMLKGKRVGIARGSAVSLAEVAYDIIFNSLFALLFLIVAQQTQLLAMLPAVTPWVLLLLSLFLAAAIAAALALRKSSSFVSRLVSTFMRSLHARNAWPVLLLTVAKWATNALSTLFIFMGLGIDINYFLLVFASAAGFILGMVSFVPGGLGVRDGIRAAVFALAVPDIGLAISVALISRVLGILSGVLMLPVVELLHPGQGMGKGQGIGREIG